MRVPSPTNTATFLFISSQRCIPKASINLSNRIANDSEGGADEGDGDCDGSAGCWVMVMVMVVVVMVMVMVIALLVIAVLITYVDLPAPGAPVMAIRREFLGFLALSASLELSNSHNSVCAFNI